MSTLPFAHLFADSTDESPALEALRMDVEDAAYVARLNEEADRYEAEFDYTRIEPTGPGDDAGQWIFDVTCGNGCGREFSLVTEREVIYVGDVHMCIKCARSFGDHSLHACVSCGVQFQSHSDYAEACSRKCGDHVDMLVEMAQDAALAREQAWLEAL